MAKVREFDVAHDERFSDLDSGTWRGLAWAGVVLQVAALIFVIWSQRYQGLWTIGGFLVLSVVFLLARGRLPAFFAFLLVIAALINATGWAWNWFNQFVWYDEMVHFFTPLAIVAALGWIGWSEQRLRLRPGSVAFVLVLGLTGLVLGALWEVAESLFLNLRLQDTLVDLLMDTLGGLCAGLFLGWLIGDRRPAVAQRR